MCFAAFGCRTKRCRHASLHIRVKLAVYEGFLKLVPFIGATLFGFRDLPCAGYFLLRGDFLQIARLDYFVHFSLLGTFGTGRMAVGQYLCGTNLLPCKPASESYLSFLERFGSFTFSRGAPSNGTMLNIWAIQFRRATFLS